MRLYQSLDLLSVQALAAGIFIDFTALIDSLIFLNDSDLLDGYRFFFLINSFEFRICRLIEFFQQ